MRRFLGSLAACATLLVTAPALGGEYEDALECGVMFEMVYLEAPEDMRVMVNDLKNDWKDHALRIGEEDADLEADWSAQKSTFYSFARDASAAEKQAKNVELGQRCRPAPDIRTYTYRDDVCAAFARHRVEILEATVDQYDSSFFRRDGSLSPEDRARYRNDAARRASKARSVLNAYRRKNSRSVRENDFSTSGEDAEAMIDSCAHSLGAE